MYLEITGTTVFELMNWSVKITLTLGVSLLIGILGFWIRKKTRRFFLGREKKKT